LETSAKTGEGMQTWIEFLEAQRQCMARTETPEKDPVS
jgi:hypothetical protein